jgi:phenylacetate-CoA ligase
MLSHFKLVNLYQKIFFFVLLVIKNKGLKPLAYFKFSKQYQWFNSTQRNNYIVGKLIFLLNKVKETNTFYKNKYERKNGIIASKDDIASYPILEKNEITENFKQMISNIDVPFKYGQTSGSTGVPLRFLVSNNYIAYQNAVYWRFLSWYNIKPYDKYVLLWGQKSSTRNSIKSTLRKFFYAPEYAINVFDLNKDTFVKHYNNISRKKPVHFRAYTSAAKQFAELASNLNINIQDIGFKLVTVTSEILLKKDREYIESIFGCKVANEYGASEIGQFAFECPDGGLHICDDANYIWTDAGNEVIVTNYRNLKFPFINYKIGDSVILSDNKCSCGRTLPLIKRVEGRSGDQIISPSGEKLSQYFFYYLFNEIDARFGNNCINKFKIIQKNNTFNLYLVKGAQFNENSIKFIHERMYKKIGNEIRIKISFTDEIKKDLSGKMGFFKNIK